MKYYFMSKKIGIILSLSLMIILIGGCTSQKNQPPQKAETQETKQSTKNDSEKSQDTGASNSETEQSQTNPMAPDFTALDQNGNEIKLSDLKGKVVFLNFWGTWCPPCREEMPDIQKVYEKYTQDRDDVAFLAVNDLSIPREKSMDEVIQWLDDKQYSFPVAFDEDGSIAQDYYIEAIPTTYMIDKEGRIFGYVSGALKEEDMISIIEQTLNKDTE